MTLRQTTQLIVQIKELLDQGKHAGQAAKLAGDYNETCLEAAHRLWQCVTMLENGNMAGCIQLAGVSPPLTELIAALKFDSLAEWQAYCNQNNLPSPPPFDDSAVNGLITALQQEDTIGPDHPLSREFSRYMMARDMEGAYSVIKVILDKDPDNQSANNIKPEIEQSILELRGRKLQEVVSLNDMEGTHVAVENIESLPFADPAKISCWPAAKQLQCYRWAQHIHTAYSRGDWQSCLDQLERIETAKTDFPMIQLPGETEQVLRQIGEWSSKLEAEWLVEVNYEDSLRQLNMFLDSQNNERASGIRMKRDAIEGLQEELAELWDNLTALGKPIPKNVQSAFETESSLLTAELIRIRRNRKLLVGTCTTIVMAICAFIIVSVISRNSAIKLMVKLDTLKKGREVELLEGEMNSLKLKSLKGVLVPGFSSKIREVGQFIDNERATEKNMASLIQELEDLKQFSSIDANDNGAACDISDKFILATNKIATLAPDIRTKMEARVATCQRKWQERLDGRKKELLITYDEILSKMETTSDTWLKLGRGLEPTQKGLSEMDKHVGEWIQATNGVPPYLSPEQDPKQKLMQRHSSIVTVKNQFNSNMVNAQNLFKAMNNATAIAHLAGYTEPLSRIVNNPLMTDQDKVAAQAVITLAVTARDINAKLFSPGTNEPSKSLDALSKPISLVRTAPFQEGDPSSIMYAKLLTDPAIHKCEAHYLVSESGRQQEIVYWMKNEANPDVKFAFNVSCQHALHSSATGWTKSPIKILMNGELWRHNHAICPGLSQKKAMLECHLDQMADLEAGKWKRPALGVTAEINKFGSLQCKPTVALDGYNEVYLAYLACQMFKLMELDPYGWGYGWSLAAQGDYKYLKEIGADKIVTKPFPSWMSFNYRYKFVRNDTKRSVLVEFFQYAARQRKYTYQQEATAFHALLQQAYNNGKNVKFIGYVRRDGTPTPVLGGKIIIGYNKTGKLTVLHRFNPVSGKLEKTNEPMPFTPLFGVLGDRDKSLNEYQRRFGVVPDNFLPGYFKLK